MALCRGILKVATGLCVVFQAARFRPSRLGSGTGCGLRGSTWEHGRQRGCAGVDRGSRFMKASRTGFGLIRPGGNGSDSRF